METYKLKRENENGQIAQRGVYGGYQPARLTWCHVTKPHRKSTVQQLCSFEFCRESLVARVFDQMTPGYTKPKLTIDRFRVAVKLEFDKNLRESQRVKALNEFDKGMKAGLHIINAFEKKYKWQSKTIMHRLVPFAKPVAPEMEIRMFEAHENWIRSSQMVSLFTLIFRMTQSAYFGTKAFIGTKTVKGIMREVEKHAKSASSGDRALVAKTMHYWIPLLKNFDSMFKGLSVTRNFHRGSLGKKEPDYRGDHPYFNGAVEGISILCDNYARDKKIKERFHEVVVRRMDDA